MGSSWGALVQFADFRVSPLYELQKGLSVSLWIKGCGPLPRWATAVCAVCVVNGRAGFCKKSPAAHHLIIPRYYTRDYDRTVNWFWNLVPVDQECHELAHGKELREPLILKQAELIGRHILHEEDMPAELGLQWIGDQIQLECLKVHIPLPSLPKL